MTAMNCARLLWFIPPRIPVMPEKIIPIWYFTDLRTPLKATIPVVHKPAQ